MHFPPVDLDAAEDSDSTDVQVVPPLSGSHLSSIDRLKGAELDGRYRIEKLLGEGGMGYVFLGRHLAIDKRVAIKVLRTDLGRGDESWQRFRNEAQAASQIGSPHIADVSDFGVLPDGGAYFVMEYLEGTNLASLLETRPVVDVSRAVRIGLQIAEGMQAAHDEGIVHRDLKPENIMLVKHGDSDDFVKILDFGIAKVGSVGTRLTKMGSVFGTPQYMSPEQASGAPLDHRSDIYALGIMLYEMVAGDVPFHGDDVQAILSKQMFQEPTALSEVAKQVVPVGLEAIVHKCLEKRPEARYAHMRDLFADLETLEKGLEPEVVAQHLAAVEARRAPRAVSATMPLIKGDAAFIKWSGWVVAGASAMLVGFGVLGVAALTKMRSANPTRDSLVSPAIAQPSAERNFKQVALTISPKEAVLRRDNADGAVLVSHGGAVTVELPTGQRVVIFASAEGFESQEVVLDGSSDGVTVALTQKKPSWMKGAAAGSQAQTRKQTAAVVEPPAVRGKCPFKHWDAKARVCLPDPCMGPNCL